jgi:hypothetical protein
MFSMQRKFLQYCHRPAIILSPAPLKKCQKSSVVQQKSIITNYVRQANKILDLFFFILFIICVPKNKTKVKETDFFLRFSFAPW